MTKKEQLKNKLSAIGVIVTSLIFALSNKAVVFAEKKGSTKDVTSGLDNIQTLFFGVIASIGAIVTAYYVVELVDAWNKNDGSGMRRAGKGIAGGLVEVFITVILAFVGVS